VGSTGRMNALCTGEVKLEGIDFNFPGCSPPSRDVFDRVVGRREFDAFELSASEYICRCATSKRRFIVLSVFPSRAFRRGFIAVNDRTVKEPTDPKGKEVGVQL
jgi:4,5-dihydroxyphthalate decarboxylase